MEYICQELSIPRKQIKETNTKNRFKCIVQKNFLKVLIKSKKIINVKTYPGVIDEWPQSKDFGTSWEQIYLVVCVIFQKFKKIIFTSNFFFEILDPQEVEPKSDSSAKVQE